jgi:hypothetical protein
VESLEDGFPGGAVGFVGEVCGDFFQMRPPLCLSSL